MLAADLEKRTVRQIRESVDKLRNVSRDVIVLAYYERAVERSHGPQWFSKITSSQKLIEFSYRKALTGATNSLVLRTWYAPEASTRRHWVVPSQSSHDE
jgi:hypothetical protein